VSAVILAVIVVMWAVVLVPMWLRRHDAATESRSVDRFSTAMRVLSRRSAAGPDRRYVVMPRREPTADVHVSGAAAPHRPAPRPVAPARPAGPRRPNSLAVRRRRVLFGLLAVTLLTFVLLVAGAISWPLQFVVDLILVSFVVHLRTQAKRAAALGRPRRVSPAAATPSAPAAPSYYAPPRSEWDTSPAVAPAVAAEPVEIDEVAATGTEDAAASGAWEPVPVPPPTYTMKPPAPPRRTWSPPPRVTEQVADAEGEPDELEGILERRWAVND
jgi:hypothetical protein